MSLRLFPMVMSAVLAAAAAAAQPAVPASAVDAIFSKWTTSTPGCAVGVAVGGRTVLMKAYGMADLEHDVPNTPDTIFESGSVAKQFTAMAIMLLVEDGRLSLDDEVRKHVPEVPDYGTAITIRHLLTHTSGLRDWGSIASIAGAPRTSRAYTHAHVLDIVSRQKSLNFPPGTQWSYSNTGFNLAAIIVDRVSGMSFAEFSRRRIFDPLGMTKTSWRDNHRRIVKGRAIAYSDARGGYEIEMPFENVHGNGGLLTTVGDLLKWNENFVKPVVGSAATIAQMTTAGKYSDGRDLDYGLGLYVRPLDGVTNVYHSGSTAGYRAHLNRFPDSHTSVAVLCNGGDAEATTAANNVSRLYLGKAGAGILGGTARSITSAAPEPLPAATLRDFTGDYWSDEAETRLTAIVSNNRLWLRRRPGTLIELDLISPNTFRGSIGTVTFRRDASGKVEALSIKQDRVWDLRFTRQTFNFPFPPPLAGARPIDTTQVNEPLELRQATASDEAVIAGQSYTQFTYERPNHVTAIVFVHSFRDALFALGWKLIDVTRLEEIPIQPETVNVAAHYRNDGRNVYVRATQEPGEPYRVNVADVGKEDWAAQLARDCRVRIHSIHFEHDRPIIKEIESEPTLRKLADLIKSKSTPPVRIEGHIDNIGEAGAAARQTLSLGRARMVVDWLTKNAGVPAAKATAEGLGRSKPIADNDTDLGRALNRRIEVARQDCAR